MDLLELIRHRRSIRKYKQDEIPRETLLNLIEAARYAPTGANLQYLKYAVVTGRELVAEVFSHTKWAAYLAPEGTPQENERPVAFLAVYIDTAIKPDGSYIETGAAVQNILLMAEAQGLGSCWLGAIDKKAIEEALALPEQYRLNALIALGYRDESPIAVDTEGEQIRYYKNEAGETVVPKRTLRDVLLSEQ